MQRLALFVVLAVMIATHSGCGRVGGKVAAKKAEKNILPWLKKVLSNPSAKKEEQEAAKGLERWWAKPGAKALEEQTAEKAAKQMALRATKMVSQSEKVGARLTTLKPRIPSVAYVLLRQQWLRNHAEIEEKSRQLLDSYLQQDQRDKLLARIQELEARNAQIDKFTEQYG
jgi:hypothetical protein